MTACALGKLGHPDGEVVLTRAAGRKGVIQMMPTLASCSLDEMMNAAVPGQPQWFQLYVNRDKNITERIVRHAESRGAKGLFITVDAPQVTCFIIYAIIIALPNILFCYFLRNHSSAVAKRTCVSSLNLKSLMSKQFLTKNPPKWIATKGRPEPLAPLSTLPFLGRI